MNAIEDLVDRYCQGWSDPDPQARARLLLGALAPGATYTDPRADKLSIDQLLAHITRTLAARPGSIVQRTSVVDVHHDVARFHWHVVLPDGTTLPEGIDFIELHENSQRIGRIVGFFGPLGGRSPP